MYIRLDLNSQSSKFLSLLSIDIKGVCGHLDLHLLHLRQVLFLNLELTPSVCLAGQESPGVLLSLLRRPESDKDLHVCTSSTLPTETSFQFLEVSFDVGGFSFDLQFWPLR